MRAQTNILAKLTASLCAAAIVASCGGPAAQAPQTGSPTFVSLNPCLDSILVEIAEPDQILALSHYSRDLASSSMDVREAARFGMTGGTGEEVIALQPDIVLASTFIAPSTKAALERAGLRVETFGSPNSVEESIAQVQQLAELTGGRKRADDLARTMSDAGWQLAEMDGPVGNDLPISVLLWQQGQIVPGQNTLIGELLLDAGFSSHSAEIGLQQADFVSLETILADPPDLVLVAGDSIGQRHPLLQDLPDTHVEVLDPTLFFCGGPSIMSAKVRLAEIRARIAEQHR